LPPRLLRRAGDKRLAALIGAGHPAAFEAIYDRHHRAILSFCRHMLGDREDAEDAAQHTFLAVHKAMGRPVEHANVQAWLFTIARNRCLDLLRARRPGAAFPLDEPSTDGLAAEVERRDDLRSLLADLGRLPEDQRAALVLSELRALSHTEIGEVIGVPTAKVKALVYGARQNLILSRQARETSCADIREQLATQSGAALRRAPLRRHLGTCPGCRAFRDDVRRQRRALAVVLPVVPTAALKANIVGGLIGTGGAAAGPAVVAAGLAKSGLAKYAALALLAGGGAAATVTAVRDHHPSRAHGSASRASSPHARGAPAPAAGRRDSRGPAATANRSARPPARTGAAEGHRPATAAAHQPRRGAARSSSHARHGSVTRRGASPSASATPSAPVTATRPVAPTSQGATHRCASGAIHAATPTRAGGRTDPGINARGPTLGNSPSPPPVTPTRVHVPGPGTTGGSASPPSPPPAHVPSGRPPSADPTSHGP
jgi:RNA polymerase sigma factor (sigma-70 family)